MKVPLSDLGAQHAAIRPELDEAIAGVLAHGRFVNGPEVARFEEDFAGFCGARCCVGCSSGTDALTLALRAAGVGPGDEVVTSAMTFIATVESIVQLGARPVLVDPEADTGLMSAQAAAAAVTSRTSALVVVHLYGQPVDLEAFRTLADRQGLVLIEDAAQAHGASWNGLRAGSAGDAAAFSFFPGKNLGALGDAGAVTTNSTALAERMRRLRDHGRETKDRHGELGTNARLDTLQAALLLVKLRRLGAWNEDRRRHAAAYDAAFSELDWIEPMRILPQARAVFHQYVVRVAERDRVRERLSGAGIATGIHYPIPLSRQPALAGLADPDAFPNADLLARSCLSLPMFPELSRQQRERVVAELAAQTEACTRAAAGGVAA